MRKAHRAWEILFHGFTVPVCDDALRKSAGDLSWDKENWVMVHNDESVTCKRCLKIMEKK